MTFRGKEMAQVSALGLSALSRRSFNLLCGHHLNREQYTTNPFRKATVK